MRVQIVMPVVFCSMLIAGCVTKGDAWRCEAEGLVNGYYTGDGTAMIHLRRYNTGGRYEVSKNDAGDEATGTTADGTPFKCVKPAK